MLSLLSRTTQDHLPKDGISYCGLSLSTPTYTQENVSMDLTTGQVNMDIISVKVPPQITPACVKLIIKQDETNGKQEEVNVPSSWAF